MKVGCSTHMKNNMTCKNKWGAIVGDFKKKNDYNARTRHNVDCWNIFIQERIGHGFP
jgi:hypothetical protein